MEFVDQNGCVGFLSPAQQQREDANPDPDASGFLEGPGIKIEKTDKGDEIKNTGVLGLSAGESEELKGSIRFEAAEDSGLKVSAVLDAPPAEGEEPTGGRIEVDVDGRGEDEVLALREVTLEGATAAAAKVLGTTDFEIAQKRIRAGDGIRLSQSEDGLELEIALALSGFTGERTVVIDVDYDPSTHSLRKRMATLKFQNGRLDSWDESAEFVAYTTAVEES